MIGSRQARGESHLLATLRATVRRWLPVPFRRGYDRIRLELPVRARDFRADRLERVQLSTRLAIPPAWLRAHIGRTSSREEYLVAGYGAFLELRNAFEASRDPQSRYPTWLDFGCGCARLCRYLPDSDVCESFVGVDVDRQAIRWNRRHIRGGDFVEIAPRPPMPFGPATFDVIYVASIFTHLDEPAQFEWLAELSRVLRVGGLLLASTHSEQLAHLRPDLSSSQLRRLEEHGFCFAPGHGRFNDDTTFHSRKYVEQSWGGGLQLCEYREKGLFGFQDLSIWKKRAPPDQSS